MKKGLSIAALAAILVIFGWNKASANTFKIGDQHNGTLSLGGGVQVPLLEGPWQVIGVSQHYGTSGSAYSSSVNNVVLAQIIDKRIKGAIYVSYNERSLSNGWKGHDKECRRVEIHYTIIREDKQNDKLCGFVNHIVFSVSSNSAQWWSDSVNTLAKRGANFPASWIRAGIWSSNRSDFVFVTYDFNPEFLGMAADSMTWEMSGWHKVRINEKPERRLFVDGISRWLDEHLAAASEGLNGKWPSGRSLAWPASFSNPDTPVLAPGTLTATHPSTDVGTESGAAKAEATATPLARSSSGSLEAKLIELKTLYEKNLITDEEYAAQRKKLLERL